MDDIIKECMDVVNEVCKKFNYDDQDMEKNDSLKTVLFKASCAMLANSSKEERELFFQMLRHTPIVVAEELTEEGLKSLENQYIGNINSHIKNEDLDLGEYGSGVPAGAYMSEPIIDENLNLVGKKSFLYVQKVSPQIQSFFNTDINVSHLIHELGHAWHAEYNQYTMGDDGILTERVGTSIFKYQFTKNNDGTFSRHNCGNTGLFIEEGMNTIEEEKAMARYKGISLDEMREVYNKVLVRSEYQGPIRTVMEYLQEKNPGGELSKWRLYGDTESKKTVEKWLEQTPAWENLKQDRPMSDMCSYEKKRQIIENIDSQRVQSFFEKYDSIYFPDASDMTPMSKIDNVLEQFYNMKMIKYSIGIEKYSEIVRQMCGEAFTLINQAEDKKIEHSVSDLRMSEVNSVTQETRALIEKDKGEERDV